MTGANGTSLFSAETPRFGSAPIDRVLSKRARAAASMAAALALMLPAGDATAQTAVRVTVEAGYDNRYTGGHWLPVSVTVESPQAISGDLEVSSVHADGSSSIHAMAVEVAGGGKKQFDLLVPAPSEDREIAARIVAGGDVVGSATARPLLLRNAALVGVLADPIPSSIQGIQAQPAQIEMVVATLAGERLDLGASALDALSYVVADGDDLAALSEAQQSALADWATTGGRILIAAETPAAMPQLGTAPEIEWNAAETRIVGADRILVGGRLGGAEMGLGQVMVTPGRIADVRREVFEAALRPPPVSYGGLSRDPFNEFGPSPEGELIRAARGGSDLRLGWFVGFLIAYLVLVGPVNYFVLRRRGRKELLWVTIPVLAFAFSGVAYGLARGARGGLDARTAGIVWADAHGQRGLIVATVSSGTGGTRTFSFPNQVAEAPAFLSFFGSTQEARTRITSQGAEVAIQTAPFSVHAAESTVDSFDGFLEARVEPQSGDASYEVTNATPYPLTDIVLIHGGASTEVGDLEPGASGAGTVERAVGRRLHFHRPHIGGALRRSLDGQLRFLLGPQFFSTPYAVASVEGYKPGIALEGRDQGVADRFMVASPVRIAPGAEHSAALDLVAVDGIVQQYNPGSLTLENFQEAVFAYSPPAALDPGRIRTGALRFFANGPKQALERYDWPEERWIPLEVPRDNRVEMTLGRDSFSETGEAYLRLRPNRHGFAEIYRFEIEAELS